MDSRPDNRDATLVPVAGEPNLAEDFRARVNDLAVEAQGAGTPSSPDPNERRTSEYSAASDAICSLDSAGCPVAVVAPIVKMTAAMFAAR